jgi:iron complex outermembrane recepter protein
LNVSHNRLRRAIRGILGVGAVAGMTFTAMPVLAQQEGAAAVEEIVVTGTRIRRAPVDGPLPITTIGREDIDVSGTVSVAEFLQAQNMNTFGSFVPASGFAGGAQGQASLSLRGLGAGRTLILVDGRRVANTPAFAGAAQNINSIPLSLIERIEVLREGASAVYGTDAIGGVINIITRREFEGVELSGQIERPTQPGADSEQYSVVFGHNSDRGNLTMAYEHFERDILFRRDRDYLYRQEPSPLGGPGSFYRISDPANIFSVIPSPNIPGAFVEPFPGCPAEFGGPDHFSSAAVNFPLFVDEDVLCLYRFTDDAGQTASTDRDSLTVQGDYQINSSMELFTRHNFVRNESFGRFAAAPVTPVFGGLTMAADNIFNPTVDEAGGPHDLVLLFRPVAGGPRDSYVTDTITESLGGIRGDVNLGGSALYEIAVFHNRYQQADFGYNYGLRPQLQALVDNEILNPFDPDPETFAGFAHTITTDNEFRAYGADASLSFDDVMGGGGLRLPIVIGGEFRKEEFSSQVDQQSAAGNVFGSAGGKAAGDRDYWAVYAETLMALVDNRVELNVAARYDNYSDFGGEVSPKIGASFRALENLVFRASYSEGFAAPSLEILNQAPSQSFPPGLIDRLGCQIDPTNVFACQGRQRETFFTNNPDLGPEQSENWNVGVVWRPMDDLLLSLDYFNISIDDGIGNLTAQNVLDNEQRCFNEGRACDPSQEGTVIRTAPVEQGGQVSLILAPSANFTKNETDGLDFTADWGASTGMGRFGLNLQATWVNSFKRATAPLAPLEEVTRAVGQPEWRANLRGTWSMNGWSASALITHIPATADCSIAKRNETPFHEDCERHFASWTQVDVQVGYLFPWDGEVVLGARNVFDRDPPLSMEIGVPAAPEPDQSLHSIFGRVPYLRYTQRF